MMNQPFSGGWRFGDRPTSVEALYQNPQAISNDFLKKVAALGQDPAKQGLLDQATTATPLTGLLEAPGSSGGGGRDVEQSAGAPSNSTGYNTNAPAMTAAAGTVLGPLAPLAKMAYDAFARNGFNATPGAITDPSLAFGSEAWGAAVNANAAARAARQAGVGDGLLGGSMIGDVSFGDGPGAGMGGMGGAFGGGGPSMGNEAGLGLGGGIGDGFGFGGLGDW